MPLGALALGLFPFPSQFPEKVGLASMPGQGAQSQEALTAQTAVHSAIRANHLPRYGFTCLIRGQ